MGDNFGKRKDGYGTVRREMAGDKTKRFDERAAVDRHIREAPTGSENTATARVDIVEMQCEKLGVLIYLYGINICIPVPRSSVCATEFPGSTANSNGARSSGTVISSRTNCV